MRYALLTLEFPPDVGGVGRMYGALANVMGERLSVFAQKNATHPTGYRLLWYVWPHWLATVWLLMWHIPKGTFIIVGHVLPLGIAVWLCSYIRKIHYTVIAHGMDITTAARVPRRRWLLRRIFARAEHVIAANKFVAAAVTTISKVNVVVIYPPVSSFGFGILSKVVNAGAPQLVSVGRLVERKGFDSLLAAMDFIWNDFPRATLTVVGSGPDRDRLLGLRSQCRYPQNVHFVGHKSDAEVAELLASASLFVMTPRTLTNGDVEGFGIVYLEAASFGLPVVATRHGGVSEAVLDGVTGVLVPENNPAAIAQAICDLFAHPEHARLLGEQGRRRTQEHFSETVFKRRVNEIFPL